MMETDSIVSRRCMNRDRIRLTGRLQKITGCKSVPFFILFDPLPDLPPRGKEFLEHFPLGRNGKGGWINSVLFDLKHAVVNRYINFYLGKGSHDFHSGCRCGCLHRQKDTAGFGIIRWKRFNCYSHTTLIDIGNIF